MTSAFTLAFLPMPGPFEMMIFASIALLLFGKRLPEVARSMGKGIVEFKKGIRGIEDEIHQSTYNSNSNSNQSSSNSRPTASDESNQVTAPKFEPPQSEPVQQS